MVAPDTSRDVRRADHAAVDALLRAAFEGEGEMRLVRQLRADGDMWVEVVKPWQGQIAGYFALSRMRAPVGWVCRAPVAVLPEWQDGRLVEGNPKWQAGMADEERYRAPWRIGGRMMREVAAVIGVGPDRPECVVVLGRPSFYERFGFSKDRACNLSSPYPIESTMILGGGEDAPNEALIYPKAFDGI